MNDILLAVLIFGSLIIQVLIVSRWRINPNHVHPIGWLWLMLPLIPVTGLPFAILFEIILEPAKK